MKRLQCRHLSVLCCLAISFSTSARAADQTIPLDLVPRDAAAFIHVRVADIWKHDSFKPVRDYFTNANPQILKDLEQNTGFLPADVESVTLLFPEFNARDLAGPPLILVRTVQPCNKLKLITALKATTPAQRMEDRFGGEGMNDGFDGDSVKPPMQPSRPKIEFKKGDAFPPRRFDVPLKEPNPKQGPDKLNDDRYDDVTGAERHVSYSEPGFWAPTTMSGVVAVRLAPYKPDLNARHYELPNARGHLFIVDERTVMFGPPAREDRGAMLAYCARLLKRTQHGPLDAAIAEATKEHSIVAALNVPELAKTIPERLPPELEKFKALLAAKSMLLKLDLKDKLSLVISVEADDAAAAKDAAKSLRVFITLAKEAMPGLRKHALQDPVTGPISSLLDLADVGLAKAAVESQGVNARLTSFVKVDAAFETAVKTALAQITVASECAISMNKLKQLGLAIHMYTDSYGQLPFPGIGKNGAPLGQGNKNANLSWRVAILPFIDEQNLYQQFKLDEPWDSEHNKKLIEKMPKLFAPVNGVKADKGHTFYQTFSGGGAFEAGTTFLTITDGLSNTLMIVEAGQAVPWTKPEDLVYDPKKPLKKLGGLFDGNFNAALCDGSVHYFRKNTPEKILRALITINGGEVVDWD